MIKGIKPPLVEVTGYVELHSFESDGINSLRSALSEIRKHKQKDCILELTYVSAPIYRVKVTASDYKTAEKVLRTAVDQGIANIESKHGTGEFHRELGAK